MPATWKLEPATGLVVMELTGAYNFDEWQQAIESILAAHAGPIKILVDARAGEAPTLRFVDQILDFTKSHSARLAGVRSAVIVGDEATYGMARMTEIRVDVSHLPVTMRVFRDPESARQWIGGERSS